MVGRWYDTFADWFVLFAVDGDAGVERFEIGGCVFGFVEPLLGFWGQGFGCGGGKDEDRMWWGGGLGSDVGEAEDWKTKEEREERGKIGRKIGRKIK